MSESAFGIDHGDVEKAFKLPGSFKPKGLPKQGGAQQAAQNFGAGFKGAVGGARRSTMPNQQSKMFGAGQGARRATNTLQANPVKTALGGAAAVGGGGYLAGRKNSRNGQGQIR